MNKALILFTVQLSSIERIRMRIEQQKIKPFLLYIIGISCALLLLHARTKKQTFNHNRHTTTKEVDLHLSRILYA